MTGWTHYNVPHGGPGTRTLLVAVEVDQALIDDPSRHFEALDRLVDEARAALAEAAGGDVVSCLVCGRTKPTLEALDRHLSYTGHRAEHDLLAAEGAQDAPTDLYLAEERSRRPLRIVEAVS